MELVQSLSASLVERDREARALVLAALAREHVLLVGQPGTAKSLLANSFAGAISEAKVFSVLLTKFSAPEEVFGPVSIAALREGRYERLTRCAASLGLQGGEDVKLGEEARREEVE